MALGINTQTSEGGDFLPRIQYDARAGRFFRIDRTQDASGWTSHSDELPLPLRMAFDFANIEVGWIKLGAGAPDFRMAKLGQQQPKRPDPDYKHGFRVLVYNKYLGVRVWSATAKCVIEQIDAMHDAWMEQERQHPGEVPVVTVTKTVPRISGQGARQSTNYAPLMTIERWVKRTAFDDVQTQAPAQPAPAATVPPPVAEPARELATAGADDPDF